MPHSFQAVHDPNKQQRTLHPKTPSSRRRPGTILTVRPFYAERRSTEKPMDPGLRRDDNRKFDAIAVSGTKFNSLYPNPQFLALI